MRLVPTWARISGYRRVLSLPVIVLVLSSSTLALSQTDKNAQSLKKILNGRGYVLQNPAASWPYPGGFLVVLGKRATFVDLPKDVPKPSGSPIVASFPSETGARSFSIGAILTGMAAIIGGNPGIALGHSSQLNFKQLDAAGTEVQFGDVTDLLKNDSIRKTVLGWLKRPNLRVYIVGQALTTSAVDVSSASAWNADIAFNGSTASKCAADASSGGANSPSDPPANAGASAPASSEKTSPSTSNQKASVQAVAAHTTSTATSSNSAAPASAATAAASSPGGELHLCLKGSSSLTLHTTRPLVFAMATYQVTRSGDDLDVIPVFLPPNVESTDGASPEQSSTIPPASRRRTWTNRPR